MFSRKNKPAAPASVPTVPTYKWKNHAATSQHLSIDVKEFDATYSPCMGRLSPPRRRCSFKGLVLTPGFKGVLAQGEIESCEPDELPSSVQDWWKKAPALFDGYASFSSVPDAALDGAYFSFNLLCKPESADALIAMCLRGIGSAGSVLRFDMDIQHPDYIGQANYWDTTWRSHRWEVRLWDVYVGVVADGHQSR
jgi:hypothetical protein